MVDSFMVVLRSDLSLSVDKGCFGCTHIWMPADLLHDLVIEMSGVSQNLSGNIVGVLHSLEHCVLERQASFS